MERMFYKGLITIRGLELVIDGFLWGLCISVWHTVSNIKSPCTATYRGTTDVLWLFRCNFQWSHFVVVTLVSRWLYWIWWEFAVEVHWRNLKWAQSNGLKFHHITECSAMMSCCDGKALGLSVDKRPDSSIQSFDLKDPLVASSVRSARLQ